jgi:glycosyltransferase involved in cell wall biosynthesis
MPDFRRSGSSGMRTDEEGRSRLSVIIPVYNSAVELGECLRALKGSDAQAWEVIVVDDASTDGSGEVATRLGVRVVRMARNAGPAAARNAGAKLATGEVLVFMDADTEAHTDTLGLMGSRFAGDGELDGVFGAYDDTPRDPGLVSRFRNLLHCQTHREAPRRANTFWAGCGAVRREVFEAAGGFDEQYRVAATEDVELGMRLARQGRRIEVDPRIQVKHLKRWKLGSMVRTDLVQRAMPFGELMMRERAYPKVLGVRQLVSAMLLAVLLPWLSGALKFGLLLGALAYVGLNLKFLRFLASKGGVRLALCGFGLLVIHHACGAAGVSAGAARYVWRGLAKRPAALAVLGVLLVGGWQAATVSSNFGGNWTGLFCTSGATKLPAELEEGTYRFAASGGYDGQFYRLVAHDPLVKRGYRVYADGAEKRWRRILVPGTAWLLAGGAPEKVDAAYLLTILLWTGLGVYGMSRWLALKRRDPGVGLGFVLFPGTLICVHFMTTDVALYALLFLCLLWEEEGKDLRLWFGLAACGLARDLGLLVIGSFVLSELVSRRWFRAAWMSTAVAPMAGWYLALGAMLAGPSGGGGASSVVEGWAFNDAGYGILKAMVSIAGRDFNSGTAVVAGFLEVAALAGVVVGVIVTVMRFRWRTAEKLAWVGLAFAALYFVASSHLFWRDENSWPRAFTPLLVAVALTGGKSGVWCWLPLAAVSLRTGLQYVSPALGILRHWF